MDYNVNEMSVAELKELGEAVKVAIKDKKANAKESDAAEKAEREAEMRVAVSAGKKVLFSFNSKEFEGEVIRVSEKSVTVKFELNGDKDAKRYRKYSEILKIIDE